MRVLIENHMQLSRDERRSHLRLGDECVEIGGDSREFRGLLAHHLGTTIPRGYRTYLCHACHNDECSNPDHLYWGTPKDNVQDKMENGNLRSPWHSMLNKHGEEKARKIARKSATAAGRAGGGHNKLDEETIQKYKTLVKSSNPEKHGWVSRTSRLMNVSHTQVRRFVKKHMSDLKAYERKRVKDT